MSRGYFENSKGTTFLNFRESDSVGHGDGVDHGVDCLGGRLQQPPGPFHYLISEQAKSLVVLQELQHEVGALLEFRDLVMETFPNLRTKLNQQQSANSTPATMTGHHHLHHSNIPISIRPSEWTPGVRIRKKLGISNNNNNSNKEKKSGNSDSATTAAVQDSGFSTEASSKETHSASSTLPTSTSATGNSETDDTEDELWNLLDIIDKKGTRLKNEVESLQNTLRDQTPFNNSSGNFQRALFHSSADDHHVKQLRQERDYLLDRLAEMEAEVLAGRLHAARLQEDLENLLSARHDLEEQLKAILTQRGAVNSRIHDLHLQFVAKSSSDEKLKLFSSGSSDRKDSSSQLPGSPVWTLIKRHYSVNELDAILGDCIPKTTLLDSKKIAAILKEYNPIILQKHLLVSTVKNQLLNQQLDTANGVEVGLRSKLDKAVEDNEDLRFVLKNATIELEGTKARVRILEEVHKLNNKTTSPDIIPDLDVNSAIANHDLLRAHSRTEIRTASMKAMSPLPINLQMDHSSSTESAHDQAEINRNKESTKRRPSKIPLKSYTAPKPPGDFTFTETKRKFFTSMDSLFL